MRRRMFWAIGVVAAVVPWAAVAQDQTLVFKE
jgi:hypothetical protein